MDGEFDNNHGWRAVTKPFDAPPECGAGPLILQQVALEIWWQPESGTRRTMQLRDIAGLVFRYRWDRENQAQACGAELPLCGRASARRPRLQKGIRIFAKRTISDISTRRAEARRRGGSPGPTSQCAGITLIEILIAVSLLSLLSVGMLVAMRIGLNTMGKTDAHMVQNRQVMNARQIVENEIGGFIYTYADWRRDPHNIVRIPFHQWEPQSMRFVTSYSLEGAWRGRMQIAALQVIPGDRNIGVRLIVNETPYTGPAQAGATIEGIETDAATGAPLIHFMPIAAGAQSFVLADKLAYCRFSYLEPHFEPPLRVWRPDWVTASLPLGIRIEMAPLDNGPSELHMSTITASFHVNRTGTLGTTMFRSERGSALLTVLWLTAALAAISLAVANNVRGETERASTDAEDMKSYFIARGAIERAAMHMQWGPDFYTSASRRWTCLFPRPRFMWRSIPETSKLSLNSITPDELMRLLTALGEPEDRAGEIAAAIIDWRTPAAPEHESPFDAFYLDRSPSFLPRHASFTENEELLLVKEITPDLYYGTSLDGSRAGLRDCVSA